MGGAPHWPFEKEPIVEIVYERVAAIDVGKKIIAVAVRTPGERAGKRRQQVRKYNTFHQTLGEMVAWLVAEGVTHVSMEATGLLEADLTFTPYARPSTLWRCCWSTPGMSRTSRVARATRWMRCGWRS